MTWAADCSECGHPLSLVRAELGLTLCSGRCHRVRRLRLEARGPDPDGGVELTDDEWASFMEAIGKPQVAPSRRAEWGAPPGHWSNGDPVHLIIDGKGGRQVAPNHNGATWVPDGRV